MYMIKNIEKEVEEITKWIKAYVEETKAEGVVIGNSGGKDCATVIALAQKAIKNRFKPYLPNTRRRNRKDNKKSN